MVCQGGIAQSAEPTFFTLLHWLRCLAPSHAALLILETVEDALADTSRAQVTHCCSCLQLFKKVAQSSSAGPTYLWHIGRDEPQSCK